jgi:hypothetical protein
MNYAYAKIIGSDVSYYPSSIEYLVSKGILTTETPSDEELVEANVVKILQVATLPPIDGHKYKTLPIQQEDGSWVEQWVSTTTSEEQEDGRNSYVRVMIQERNTRLAYCDWTQLPDVPQATREAWVPYRQALRDVPAQSGFPFNIEWPQPPNR